MIIVKEVMTAMTQQKKGKQCLFCLYKCIFLKEIGSVFYLYATAMFLLLLSILLSSSLSPPQQSPMAVGIDHNRHRNDYP